MRPSNSTSKPATVTNNTGAGTVIISPDNFFQLFKYQFAELLGAVETGTFPLNGVP